MGRARSAPRREEAAGGIEGIHGRPDPRDPGSGPKRILAPGERARELRFERFRVGTVPTRIAAIVS